MTEALARMSLLEFFAWMTAASFVRYWVIAGIPYFVFYKWRPNLTRRFKVQASYPGDAVVRFEFFWGNVSSLLVALSVTAAFAGWQAGLTRIYTDVSEFGVVYFVASVAIMALIHDTWFYWTHRLLHHKLFFKRFHAIHHRSLNPTPWASLSFHPVESVLSFGFFPLMIFVLPFHPDALACFFVLMFVGNVSGHSGFEVGRLTPLKKFLGGALIHNLHHTKVTKNFGLYTNFWDLVCGTFADDFADEFRRMGLAPTSERKQDQEPPRDAPPRAG